MKIILITLDTLRADRLGCYGYHLPTSPYIDQIAKEGVIFDKAFAADIPTEVAHTDLFTGKVGLSTGVIAHGSKSNYLQKNIKWLPSMLRKKGITTAAVDNLYHLQEWFARGFKYYMNTTGENRWIDGRTINDFAIPWLRDHAQDDFFLFLHYWDPHTPYLPPKEYLPLFYDTKLDPFDKSNRSMDKAYSHTSYPNQKLNHYDFLGEVTDSNYVNALYDSEIRYLDDLLKELDSNLSELGIKDDVFLIILGDHGESLLEHGIYWDHCGLYDNTVRVPMIMRYPSKIKAGQTIKGMVQQADIMPTILQDANLDVPNDLDGKSLWPVINGHASEAHTKIYLSECAHQASRGIRTNEYKFMKTKSSGIFSRPEIELYDLIEDPNEEHNIAEKLPELTRIFSEELDCWVQTKLNGKEDPMDYILNNEMLPKRKKMEQILMDFGLTYEEWISNPSPTELNKALESLKRKKALSQTEKYTV
ncbi:sulfatase [Paenibacillus periandrae]|uniref:sulfatase n=1 Tax=Paenibacillus periandrae TaxID=1761741 RepID=UPI001F08D972|nr:sulfatase [Paenibacillus periandrae]